MTFFKKTRECNEPLTALKNKLYFSKLTGKTQLMKKQLESLKLYKNQNQKNGQDVTMVHCKSDAVLLTGTLSEFRKDSFETFGLNRSNGVPFCLVLLMNYLHMKVKTCRIYPQKNIYFLIQSVFRGGLSGILGPRYFEFNEETVLEHDHVNNLYALPLTQKFAYDEILFNKNTSFEPIFTTPNASEI